jgi:glycosyltransferase involved in cell wall biosynthesis
MRILFASVNHLPHVGGVEITTHQLALRLVSRGHSVAVLAGLLPWSGTPSVRERLLGRWLRLTHHYRAVRDNKLGYSVYRALDPPRSAESVLETFQPDIMVINAGSVRFVDALRRAAKSFPIIVYLHSVSALGVLKLQDIRACTLLAIAPHVVSLAAEQGYRANLLPPLVELDQYRPPSTRRTVLFVNPIRTKGVDIAWALAERRPDVPFVFRQAWGVSSQENKHLRDRCKRQKNVKILRATRDPAEVYADAKILLAPYPAIEGYGRVIVEAEALGIPVVATDAPGLRFAAGDGATFVKENSPIGDWEAALNLLWDDSRVYDRYSRAAIQYVSRPEISPHYIAQQFEAEVSTALATRPLELVKSS